MTKEKKLLKPANSAYLLKPGHDLIFNEVIEWKSDIEFYQMEISFLTKLLDKAFLRITKRQETLKIQSLEEKLKTFRDITLKDLLKEIRAYEKKLSKMDESVFYEGEIQVLIEQSEFRTSISSVIREMKKLKKDVYDIVENQMRIMKKINKDYQEGKLTL